jgi:hypothetical protein
VSPREYVASIKTKLTQSRARCGSTLAVWGSIPLSYTVEQRREKAAELYNIRPETFRRDNHEGILIWELAYALYERPPDTCRSQAS